MSSIGNRLKKLRLRKGYELDKLAYLTKLDPELLEKLEMDENIGYSIADIVTLSRILDTSIDYLLLGDQLATDNEEENGQVELNGHSFLSQVVNEEILAYMSDYPITFWANLFRKMCRKDISPDGMCKLIDAVDTVKPGDENGNHQNGNKRAEMDNR